MALPVVRTDAGSFTTFLTEDMFDKAMNNIQEILDENSDVVFIDDETSETSSNGEDDCSTGQNVGLNNVKETTENNVQIKYSHTNGVVDKIMPSTIILSGIKSKLSQVSKISNMITSTNQVNKCSLPEGNLKTDEKCVTNVEIARDQVKNVEAISPNATVIKNSIELCLFDKNSTDNTEEILNVQSIEKKNDKNSLEIECERNTADHEKTKNAASDVLINKDMGLNSIQEKCPINENTNSIKEMSSANINMLGNANDLDDAELSDEDECGSKIDNVLEKEMENNLMAEIGLPSQGKKMCFALNDYNINEDENEIVKVKTLNKDRDIPTTDASSMVECILDSPAQSSSIPNTSNTSLQTATKVKTIYMPRKQQTEIVKQFMPIFTKSPNQNKNIKYLIKVNNNNTLINHKPKLKLIPIQKSPEKQTLTKNDLINDNSFNEQNFNNQVIESQLPPYASSNLVAASKVYCCEECHDTFLLESSLKYHMSRRSVIISYWCHSCHANMKFYNRCLMLKHTRLHNMSQSVSRSIKPSIVALETLPLDCIQLGLPKCITEDWEKDSLSEVIAKYVSTDSEYGKQKSKTIKAIVEIPRQNIIDSVKSVNVEQNKDVNRNSPIQDVENCTKTNERNVDDGEANESRMTPPLTTEAACESLNTSPQIRINGVYSLSSQSEPNLTNIAVDTDNNLLNEESVVEDNLATECEIISVANDSEVHSVNNTLTKCSECDTTVVDMQKHLNQLSRPIDHNLTCRVCRLVLPSKCALKIHLRVHMKISPFKCPECGKQFPSFKKLLPHIKYVCGHSSRLVKFMCPKCNRLCSNMVQLQSHIFSLHTNRVFKCNICTFAFFNITSLKKHQARDHPDNNNQCPSMYQQCTLCPNKLIPKSKITTHISEHAQNPDSAFYSFPCPGCRLWYTNNQQGFVTHLSKCVKVQSELEKLKEDNLSNIEISAQEEHLNSNNSSPDIIEMCEKDPLSLDDWDGSKEHHVKEKRIELCIVCKKEQVIIMPGADLNTQSLCCKLCVKPFDIEKHDTSDYIEKKVAYKLKTENEFQQVSLNNTDTRKKSSRPIKRKMSLDFEYHTNTPSEKSDSTCSSPEIKKVYKNRQRFKKSKTENNTDENGLQFVRGQVIPENQPDKECSKCGHKAYNVDEFRDHVLSHRTDPNAFQCLECGLCFVVRPSLEKHLIVLHRIKNVEEYIKNNNVGGPTIKEEPEDQEKFPSEDVQENQCRVCFMNFDSAIALNQHFRTHGMAFLMSSQKQSKK